jgi:hypothetical protein
VPLRDNLLYFLPDSSYFLSNFLPKLNKNSFAIKNISKRPECKKILKHEEVIPMDKNICPWWLGFFLAARSGSYGKTPFPFSLPTLKGVKPYLIQAVPWDSSAFPWRAWPAKPGM